MSANGKTTNENSHTSPKFSNNNNRRKMDAAELKKEEEESYKEKPTNYFQAIVHLFKGNIGPGLFAMGFAFKHGGIAVSTPFTLLLALTCIHCQHLLVNCSIRMRAISGDEKYPDFAETVEQCFANSPTRFRTWSKSIRIAVNVFICITQLGFCCIYFVFISTNIKKILLGYDIIMDVRILMIICFVPIWLSILIRNLKYLAPVSAFAALCMILSLGITLYYATKDGLPPINERRMYTTPRELAIYFGTAIFAFEGIALVLPIKNCMKKPEDFDKPFGVLNVGMFIVTTMFTSAGFIGYTKWGEQVAASLSLNLGKTWGGVSVQVMVSLGVLFGYCLQFHIAIQIMLPTVTHAMTRHIQNPLLINLGFRTIMSIVTLSIALLVPALGLFISLIGALCSTALALVFPPLIDMLTEREGKYPHFISYTKNFLILLLAVLGFAVGSFESLYGIITHFGKDDLS
uniref:Amino acid transporter transmembrane domain-containing protein n=1 Tax=Glossina brevipalpis TaxID=37001 RepID=A0A1A9WVJ0_9MUSC